MSTNMAKNREDASRRITTALPWWGLALVVAAADFLTKEAVRINWPEGTVLAVTSFFNFVSVRNPGAAFSLFAQAGGWQRYFLSGLALVVAVVLMWMLMSPMRRREALGYALILGGAIGNAIDRVVYGEVTDFLDFHASAWHWPAFNGADIGIFLGAACMILSAFGNHAPPTPTEAGRPQTPL